MTCASLLLSKDASTEVRNYINNLGLPSKPELSSLSKEAQKTIKLWEANRVRFVPKNLHNPKALEKLAALNIAVQEGAVLSPAKALHHKALQAFFEAHEAAFNSNLASQQITIYR